MPVARKFDAVAELSSALASRSKPLLIKLDENDCIIAAHYDYSGTHSMGIAFRHDEGYIDIGNSPPADISEYGMDAWFESVDPNLSDGLPGLALISNFTDKEAAEIGLKFADYGGPASGGVSMVRFSGDLQLLQTALTDKALPYRFVFGLETDV